MGKLSVELVSSLGIASRSSMNSFFLYFEDGKLHIDDDMAPEYGQRSRKPAQQSWYGPDQRVGAHHLGGMPHNIEGQCNQQDYLTHKGSARLDPIAHTTDSSHVTLT